MVNEVAINHLGPNGKSKRHLQQKNSALEIAYRLMIFVSHMTFTESTYFLPNTINRFVFIMGMQFVLREISTKFLCIIR
jgi:hypothetical protein